MSRSTFPMHSGPSTGPFLPTGENPAFSPDHLYTPANDRTGGPFTIGRVIHSSRGVGFTGWIGGVAVFNRAQNPEGIARLPALGRAAPISTPNQ